MRRQNSKEEKMEALPPLLPPLLRSAPSTPRPAARPLRSGLRGPSVSCGLLFTPVPARTTWITPVQEAQV
ncbi:hypothetical protein E2C01_050593 [Portunus trituberculatus]|uniref:Uncharacterized protein n=1 Tax=Portunus trituberculatus TaxID=210409 RepID=A0A5B7GGL0_PORTR|nr:hypothetical protein [Portunus trituberculatus]